MTAAAAEPKYISRLALQANPFSTEVGEAGLYLGPEIKQRLDLVLHLLLFYSGRTFTDHSVYGQPMFTGIWCATGKHPWQ